MKESMSGPELHTAADMLEQRQFALGDRRRGGNRSKPAAAIKGSGSTTRVTAEAKISSSGGSTGAPSALRNAKRTTKPIRKI